MGVAAVRAALAEAGVERPAASRPRSAAPRTPASRPATRCSARSALTGIPIVDVEAGCASGGAALELAAGAIRAGQYDSVLVFGMEKMPKGIIRSSFFEPWREEAGLAATPAYFALRAQRLMRESRAHEGRPRRVVVKNRRHGVDNPNAMFRKEIDRRGRCSARASCASPCTSSCSARRTRARRGRRAAPCHGADAAGVDRSMPRCCARTSPGSVLGEATPLAGIDDSDITPPATLAADDGVRRGRHRSRRRRRRRSARTPTPPASCSRWEELGLCAPGDQAPSLDGRRREHWAAGGR